MSKLIRIGELARLSRLSVEALRYYETQQLISPQSRTPAGYRLYSDSTVKQLNFINRCKSLGFTLHEIRELLQISQSADASAADVKALVEHHRSAIQQKITQLSAMEQDLATLSDCCSGDGDVSECPILDFLRQDDSTLGGESDCCHPADTTTKA